MTRRRKRSRWGQSIEFRWRADRAEPHEQRAVSCCNPSILRWLSVSRWREEALRLKATEAGSATRMPMWAAFGSHHHPVELIDFEPYTEIMTRPTGPRECADAPPFVIPELRAAHRVGAPVRRRGRVHHPPYDAAHN